MTNKQKLILFLILIVSASGLVILKPVAENAWSQFRDGTDPKYLQYLQTKWTSRSTSFLMQRMQHPSIFYSAAATSILRGRTGEKDISKLIKIIEKRTDKRSRVLALSVLYVWDQKTATNISMKILEDGENNTLFEEALAALSHRQYMPAFPYLVAYAQRPDGYKNGSIKLLGDFKQPEAIPILAKMLNQIDGESPVAKGILKDSINDSIQKIRMHATEQFRNPDARPSES